jgi:hypothetical protein
MELVAAKVVDEEKGQVGDGVACSGKVLLAVPLVYPFSAPVVPLLLPKLKVTVFPGAAPLLLFSMCRVAASTSCMHCSSC